jgi:hypothetical protein
MMKVGVICEGPTDFVAIETFFGAALSHNGLDASFKPIQPEMDNTCPDGGWGNVLLWLNKNPPNARISKLFGGGLFGGELGAEPLDCLLIQLDTDALEEPGFQTYVKKTYDYSVQLAASPADRAKEICNILECAWGDDMTDADKRRHIPSPAVESTETWCIAAFTAQPRNFEVMGGQVLVDSFMHSLETTEGRMPTLPYAAIDKNIKRRQRFCNELFPSARRVSAGCPQFAVALNALIAIAPHAAISNSEFVRNI